MSLARTSISRTLSLIIACSILASAVLIAGTTAVLEAHRQARARVAYVEAAAGLFAAAVSQGVADDDRSAVLRALRGVSRTAYVEHVQVQDSAGNLIAEIGSGVRLDSDVSLVDGRQNGQTLAIFRSATLLIKVPIIQGGTVVGQLQVMANNSDLLRSLGESLLVSAFWSILATALALLVANRMKPTILRPLAQLTATVQAIARTRDYGKSVPVLGNNEIGTLCEGFNDMMAQVRTRDAKITELALTDIDTGLPNRAALEDWLTSRPAQGLAVATLAVNRFVNVRGAIGYGLAEELMAVLGRRLQALAQGAMVARVASDSLAVAYAAKDPVQAKARAEALARAAEADQTVGGLRIDVDVTVGYAVLPAQAAAEVEDLIRWSVIAVEQARGAGHRLGTFDAKAYGDPARNLSLISDLKAALGNGEARLLLQPKVSSRTGLVCGAEALMRWTSQTRGVVPPDLFIGMAEETGAIREVTLWGLDQALEQSRQLTQAGWSTPIALNVSGRLIGDRGFITDALNRIGDSRADLTFEITETALIENPTAALGHIRALGARGVDVAIDDYGVGLSSLAYLKQIPAQELKIDKSYVQPLVEGKSRRDVLLVKSTIDLAHSLGMKVTAEGVEQPEVMAMLAGMGCDYLQGWLFGRAMSLEAFLPLRQADTPPWMMAA